MPKKKNYFLRLLLILFIVFLGLYIASISGYYESKVGSKVALTEDAIKKFEEDVLNGEEVDIKSYLDNDMVDYSNSFTDAGDKITASLENILTEGFSGIWDAIKVLFF